MPWFSYLYSYLRLCSTLCVTLPPVSVAIFTMLECLNILLEFYNFFFCLKVTSDKTPFLGFDGCSSKANSNHIFSRSFKMVGCCLHNIATYGLYIYWNIYFWCLVSLQISECNNCYFLLSHSYVELDVPLFKSPLFFVDKPNAVSTASNKLSNLARFFWGALTLAAKSLSQALIQVSKISK